MNDVEDCLFSCGQPDLKYFDKRMPPKRRSCLTGWEEPGTFWLWAWPDLLKWKAQITWLFSPVTGKYPWPGDLWGVDADGDLVLVETKSTLVAHDPFEDFVPFQKIFSCGKWEQSVQDIILRWPRVLKNEREFINRYRKELEKGPESCIDYPGVVPTSCKRLATWRWRELYLDKIASLIEGPDYERAAQTGLEGLGQKAALSSLCRVVYCG